jgi:hypothetical protein
MKLVAFLLATILITNFGPSCITSSEEFAVETVVSNYSLSNAIGWQKTDLGYASVAESDSRLIVVLSEIPSVGLSIKLQTPTEIVESTTPLLKITSSSATGTIRPDVGHSVNGWAIDCTGQACKVEKNDILIQTHPMASTLETSVEIKHSLTSCDSCRGVCISAAQNPVCVDAQTKQDIDVILKYLNISNNFNELLDSYRVTSESLEVKDIAPSFSESIKWNEVVQQELTELRTKQIISLSDEDIASIADLSKKGQAGERYRIVKDNDSWKYYYQVPGALINGTKDCNAYSMEVQSSPQTSSLNAFYLVPIVLVSIALGLFLILIVISRTLVKRKPQKI